MACYSCVCNSICVVCSISLTSKLVYLTPILHAVYAHDVLPVCPTDPKITITTHFNYLNMAMVFGLHHLWAALAAAVHLRLMTGDCVMYYNGCPVMFVCFQLKVKLSSLSRVSPYAFKHLLRLSND